MNRQVNSLGVYINRVPGGTLERQSNGRILFRRSEDLEPEIPIALGWEGIKEIESEGLHPVFQQSLPEGILRETLLSNLTSTIRRATDDLTLARIVGRSLVGRIRLAESPGELETKEDHCDYRSEVMEGRLSRKDLLANLISRFPANAGVAGVHPKIQVSDTDKLTIAGPTHILKTFDPEMFPGLAANEFLCTEIARYAGLETSRVELSEDGLWLAVERFDRMEDGSYLAFEDFCSLANIATGWKYFGDYENIAETVRRYTEDPGAEAGALFERVALSCLLRDGDAHRKNFGLLYSTSEDVRLAPVYDVVCTEAYLTGETLALELGGSKSWPDVNALKKFGTGSCWMGAKAVDDTMDRLCGAVEKGRDLLLSGDFPGMSKEIKGNILSSLEESLRSYGCRKTKGVCP